MNILSRPTHMHIFVIYSVCIVLCQSRSITTCSHILLWRACMPKCYSLWLLLTHSYVSSKYNTVWTSQYSVFCIQIFDNQLLSPSNSRSIASHFLARSHVTPHSSKTRSMLNQHLTSFISASRNISLRQELCCVKNAPSVQAIQRFLGPQNTSPSTAASSRIRTSNKFKNKNTPTKAVLRPPADECSSPIRQTSSMHAGNPVCR